MNSQEVSNSAVSSPTGISPPAAAMTDDSPAGPTATSRASHPNPSSAGPALNPRSCVTCRRRKVRCDKLMPCSNCTKNKIPCIFPAPGRAPRRPRPKDPNAPPKNSTERELELMKRLRKLENIVEDLSGQIEVESGSGRHHSSAGNSPEATADATGHPSASLGGSSGNFNQSPVLRGDLEGDAGQNCSGRKSVDMSRQFGRLVLNDQGKASRYVSSAFWSKLNDEVCLIALRWLVNTFLRIE
jgi:hypothetical protein